MFLQKKRANVHKGSTQTFSMKVWVGGGSRQKVPLFLGKAYYNNLKIKPIILCTLLKRSFGSV